ncbi:putative tRNA sulfurtransferase [Virgibacillus pantothenticus]|uniref:Probable tRNA sulfurtransferase n=1 Tax=Virgibacillus pantothenticus TaxID=1473 RepID=A0A0L0QRG7_VIRPA|nr:MULTISPECIES: tRNA uracil 4-sulfurtransferase ThiI [Virgibacillus]API90851.1 tRNA 4-thiouridine(8) synthase ThiI [Virgibacillus sp. 6R]KNE20798.1 thiamine biosynthesis protein ThiI [Virgibacillus pantothenticus]MBS7426713.1 tRNA 4-thiouridine(8) synthase ThiI [Virgibacillus sp. 19R1-5]MBU8566041.1 tRNA 4-thiouridine(8) synthase ThiI [Virgibacillus pantothenticus]MBU8602786.1 tRNA 4-thiouridine(8) synthase ThiI [Virgibacillus pantothenticus]
MQYDYILIRYGEMALKGKNIKAFILRLQENIQNKLQDYKNVKVKRTQGRMFILLNGHDPEPIIDKCKHIFGIQSLSLAIKEENDPDKVKEAALYALKKNDAASTFKVTVKRINKDFPIRSQEFNHVVGKHLLTNTNGITVDVHQPDVEIKIEIRNEATYITSSVVQGAGGLPVGTSGKSLLLLSGGIDSPVAGYLAMKRGVQLEAIHFHSPPFTSERAKQKVLDLAKQLTQYGKSIQVHLVPFTKLQQEIFRQIPDGYAMTIMRRIMMRISEKVCQEQGILSITTGENLGQVASQTMESMNVINEVTNYPILRPLVAMDKTEIIDIAKKIGTYETSILPYEDCCTVFVPKSPKTKPKREKANHFEAKADLSEWVEEALQNIETIKITSRQENTYENLF